MSAKDAARPRVRVLVAEDDPELRHLLSVVLDEPDREVVLASSGGDVEGHLGRGGCDLLVLDLMMPDLDGRSLLRTLRSRAATAATPVVVLTTRLGPKLRAECYELGADMVVEKPFDPELLQADVTARLERAQAMEREARQDDLTDLLNLAGFLEALENDGVTTSPLLVAGIDGLHDIYDRFGWGTAEMIAYEVAMALRRALPETLVLARLTGGEFAILMPGCTDAEAREHAPRVVDAVRRVPIRGSDGESFRLTASAALAPAGAGADGAAVRLERVREAARRAHDAGGNRLAHLEDAGVAPGAEGPVLVAEDDDITAKILVHRLEKEGFRVVRFGNGQEAYRGALEETPCAVVLDVKMPGMDGFELLQRLRKTPTYAGTPVMMLTSMGSEADVVRGFQLGADDYMLKPFSPVEFLARLRRLLRRGHTPSTS